MKHRGLANKTSTPRPLVYVTYAKPWYADLNNSEQAGYLKLPAIIKKHNRKVGRERAAPRDGEPAKNEAEEPVAQFGKVCEDTMTGVEPEGVVTAGIKRKAETMEGEVLVSIEGEPPLAAP